MTEYRVSARRIDNHGSLTVAKETKVVLDTDMAMRREAMNLVELGSAFCWAVALNTVMWSSKILEMNGPSYSLAQSRAHNRPD